MKNDECGIFTKDFTANATFFITHHSLLITLHYILRVFRVSVVKKPN